MTAAGSTKALGLYLRHVLERIAEHPINNLDLLLPWNVVAEIERQQPPRNHHCAVKTVQAGRLRKYPSRAWITFEAGWIG